jgi:hypothetical protein
MATAVSDIRVPEWRDAQENNKFPFADRATLTADTAEFLPESLFLDASIHIPGAVGRIRLSKLTVRAGIVTLTIGDEQQPARASGSFDPLEPDDCISLVDNYGRVVGTLVSEASRLNAFQAWSEGTRTFTVEATEFAASCCFSLPEIGFRGFVLDDGSVFTGDIFLVGENGVVLSHETYYEPIVDGVCVAQQAFEAIRVDVVGDPLFRRASCEGDAFPLPRFVRRIIVKHDCQEIEVLPDSRGDFKIAGGRRFVEDPALRVQSVGGALQFTLLGTPRTSGT